MQKCIKVKSLKIVSIWYILKYAHDTVLLFQTVISLLMDYAVCVCLITCSATEQLNNDEIDQSLVQNVTEVSCNKYK